MKPLHIIHVIVTLLLLIAVLTFGVLAVAGVIEIHIPGRTQADGRLSGINYGTAANVNGGVKAH